MQRVVRGSVEQMISKETMLRKKYIEYSIEGEVRAMESSDAVEKPALHTNIIGVSGWKRRVKGSLQRMQGRERRQLMAQYLA